MRKKRLRRLKTVGITPIWLFRCEAGLQDCVKQGKGLRKFRRTDAVDCLIIFKEVQQFRIGGLNPSRLAELDAASGSDTSAKGSSGLNAGSVVVVVVEVLVRPRKRLGKAAADRNPCLCDSACVVFRTVTVAQSLSGSRGVEKPTKVMVQAVPAILEPAPNRVPSR